MTKAHKTPRPYRAPNRDAAAERTRESIVSAATQSFETVGWAGTTIAAIARSAAVSPKTVEAVFKTKAALLAAAVDYAIRGDIEPVPMMARASVAAINEAPDARTMLWRHARHLRAIHERSARIAWTVEHAADADVRVGQLWQRMNDNRTAAVRRVTDAFMTKPGRNTRLTRREVEAFFWVGVDWGAYRTLTEHAGLSPGEYESWLRRYYRPLMR